MISHIRHCSLLHTSPSPAHQLVHARATIEYHTHDTIPYAESRARCRHWSRARRARTSTQFSADTHTTTALGACVCLTGTLYSLACGCGTLNFMAQLARPKPATHFRVFDLGANLKLPRWTWRVAPRTQRGVVHRPEEIYIST